VREYTDDVDDVRVTYCVTLRIVVVLAYVET
jgi:hypothetical protein